MTRSDRERSPRRSQRRRALWIVTLSSLTAMGLLGAIRPSSAEPKAWSVTPTANVGSGNNELDDVACTSPTNCVAVGEQVTAGSGFRHTLAETWSGSSWTIAPTTNPGSRDNVLTGVSCASTSGCFAVGSFDNGAGLTPLIESWDGTTWVATSGAAVPNNSELTGISCASITGCVAVGYSVSSTTGSLQTLAEIWDGTTWSVKSTPNPNPDSVLNGVSCANTTSCTAVGYSVNTAGNQQTLVETWDGASWTSTSSPNTSTDSILNAVSCPTATSCVAVGNSDDGASSSTTLILSWSGTTWSKLSSPNTAAPINDLRGVSCWITGKCIAVGWTDTAGATQTLVESSLGASWSIDSSPNPATAQNELFGAACASSTNCFATGRRSNGNFGRTLALAGFSPADVTAPTVSLPVPADGAFFVTGQSVAAKYTCSDEAGGTGVASCVGTVAPGAAINTTTPGPGSFSVTGTDYANNTTTTTTNYSVVNPTSASLIAPSGGGTVSTDPGSGPTPVAPVATTLTGLDAGTLSINQQAVTLTPPAGLNVLGIQIAITAPPASAGPLALTFDTDAALLPPGTTSTNIALLKDAALVPDCLGATVLPNGIDACVTTRTDAPSGGGDLRITAIAATSGQWNIATGTPGLPTLNAGNGTATERQLMGTAILQAPITLSQPSALPVTVNYATANGTALAGPDYIATSGTLTFTPGQIALTVPISIPGDLIHELKETFALGLSSPVGATIGTAVGTEKILDNDAIAPAAPTVTALGYLTQARLTWTGASSEIANGGSPVTSYLVQVYLGTVLQPSFTQTVTCTQPCTPATSYVVAGLTNGNTYTFAVSAHNAKGTGAPGTSAVMLVDISSGGYVPARPAAPVATAGTGQVTITWAAPLNGSATISSYAIKPFANGVALPAIRVGVSPTSYVFTGATPGTAYRFRIEATNFFGPGATSVSTNIVTPT